MLVSVCNHNSDAETQSGVLSRARCLTTIRPSSSKSESVAFAWRHHPGNRRTSIHQAEFLGLCDCTTIEGIVEKLVRVSTNLDEGVSRGRSDVSGDGAL